MWRGQTAQHGANPTDPASHTKPDQPTLGKAIALRHTGVALGSQRPPSRVHVLPMCAQCNGQVAQVFNHQGQRTQRITLQQGVCEWRRGVRKGTGH